MEIEKIQDIEILRKIAYALYRENCYFKESCSIANETLAKHTRTWYIPTGDSIEIQAIELNSLYEKSLNERNKDYLIFEKIKELCEETQEYYNKNTENIESIETFNKVLVNALTKIYENVTGRMNETY